MVEIPINILVKLLDNASPELKKINAEAIAEVQKLSGEQNKAVKETDKVSDNSTKKITDNAKKQRNAIQKVNDQVRLIRRNMVAFTIAVGFAGLAINTFAQTSGEARKFLDDLGLAAKNTLSKLGEYITVAAEFYKITDAVENFNKKFGNEQLNNITEAANALKNFGEKQKNTANLFVTGKITATEYFQRLLAFQDSAISKNQQFAQSFQQLSQAISIAQDTQLAKTQNTANSITQLMTTLSSYQHTLAETLFTTINSTFQTLTAGLGDAVASIVTGAETAKEAFSALGKAIISTIVKIFVEYAAQALIAKAFDSLLVKASIAQATALAAAWYPAALFKTIVTGAGAVAKGVASISAGTAIGLGIMKGLGTAASGEGGGGGGGGGFHDGGFIRAHNGLAVDEVPIIAQTGEGILSRRGMRALGGEQTLNKLNSGQPQAAGNVYVEVNYPVIREQTDIKDLARQLGFEIQSQLRQARGI